MIIFYGRQSETEWSLIILSLYYLSIIACYTLLTWNIWMTSEFRSRPSSGAEYLIRPRQYSASVVRLRKAADIALPEIFERSRCFRNKFRKRSANTRFCSVVKWISCFWCFICVRSWGLLLILKKERQKEKEEEKLGYGIASYLFQIH